MLTTTFFAFYIDDGEHGKDDKDDQDEDGSWHSSNHMHKNALGKKPRTHSYVKGIVLEQDSMDASCIFDEMVDKGMSSSVCGRGKKNKKQNYILEDPG